MIKNRIRCDHCGKWIIYTDSVTLPEEMYSYLTSDGEFAICYSCGINKKYNINYWKDWVSKKREQKGE